MLRNFFILLLLSCSFELRATSWSTGAQVDGTANTIGNLSLVYDGDTDQIIGAGCTTPTGDPVYSAYNGSEWSTVAAIPAGESIGVQSDIYTAYNADTTTQFATWADASTYVPYYSLYDGSSWSTAATIPKGTSTTVYQNVTLAYDSDALQMIAVWTDNSSHSIYYSIYSDSSWSTAETIPLGASAGAMGNVHMVYDSNSSLVFAAWGDYDSSALYYSTYDGTSWSVTPGTINQGASAGTNSILLSYDSTIHDVFAIWITDEDIYYSIYSGSSWSTGTTMPLGSSSGANNGPCVAYDPYSLQTICAWSDIGTNACYYSAYTSGSWSTASTIPLGVSLGSQGLVSLAYDDDNEQMYAAWADWTTDIPFYSVYNGTNWSTDAEEIPLGDYPGVDTDVILSYDGNTQQVIATWGELTVPVPYFTVYNGSSWSSSEFIPIGDSVGADGVTLVYDENTNTVIATWQAFSNDAPYYSIYDGSSWSTGAAIPKDGSAGVENSIFTAYDSSNYEVFAAWVDEESPYSYYSIYDGSTWSTAATMPLGDGSGAASDVFLAYYTSTQQMFASWGDYCSSDAYYSIYNGSWSTPATIPLGASNGVRYDVFLVEDAASGYLVAAWTDYITEAAYYSIYNGSEWSAGAAIPLGSSNGVNVDVLLGYDSNLEQVFAAWGDRETSAAYYATYGTSGWSTGAAIPLGTSEGVAVDVTLAYSPSLQKMFSAWVDTASEEATYYSYIPSAPPTPSILPPKNLAGFQTKHRFVSQTEISNTIKWQVPSSGTAPVSYLIYRDSLNTLIGTVSARGPLTFEDHNRKKNTSYTYYIVSVDNQGNRSAAASVTVFSR